MTNNLDPGQATMVVFPDTMLTYSSTLDKQRISAKSSKKQLKSNAGLENSTRPLVFTSASGCRASENFDISSENYIFSLICQ